MGCFLFASLEGAFCMKALVVASVTMILLVLLTGALYPNDNVRVLRGEIRCLSARIEDIEKEKTNMLYRGRKPRNDEISPWIDDGRKLLEEVEGVLRKTEARGPFLCSKMMNAVDKCTVTVLGHEKVGYKLLRQGYPPKQGPIRGNPIPVRELIGLNAVSMLGNIQNLLQGDEVRRVLLYGVKGIGKTILMKHLYNSVLKWVRGYDRVIWVTSPAHFTIKNVQEAVAAAVKCDLPFGDDLNVRAAKLSNSLASLGRFVIFLDDVPKANFSLEEAGIPSSIWTGCKLVLTSTTEDCRMLDGFVPFKVPCFPLEEAYHFFLHEAGLDMESVAAFGDIPRLLSDKCRGVPSSIVDIAACMCGILDIHEWRNALFES